MNKKEIYKKLIIPATFFGSRLDQALSELLPELSRSKIQNMIKLNLVLINGNNALQKHKVFGDEEIIIKDIISDELTAHPENMSLDIIYEDDDLIVLNKPKSLVVHPGSGNSSGTLLNGLLYYNKQLERLPRGGIVHRLDKDTTGLMVVAKNEESQNNLVDQLQSKSVYREYRAIVWGQLWKDKVIDKPIGRHPRQRTKMAINKINGKEATTKFEILERFNFHTYIRCLLQTGRTHQIRVHMLDNNSPIVGDPDYGIKKIIPSKKINPDLLNIIKSFDRQALHAISLGLIHPKTGQSMKWSIDLPEDMKNLLNVIREDSEGNVLDDHDPFLNSLYELNQPIDIDESK